MAPLDTNSDGILSGAELSEGLHMDPQEAAAALSRAQSATSMADVRAIVKEHGLPVRGTCRHIAHRACTAFARTHTFLPC